MSEYTPILVLASGNPGKLREIRRMLAPLNWDVRPQHEWSVDDAVENGLTFVENALIKARHASLATGLPALGDDSGIVVAALGGRPGIHSARYSSGGDETNNQKLLGELKGVPDERRLAHFTCVMVFVRHAEDPEPLISSGQWHGRIAHEAAGEGGFGYDPLFYLPDRRCTSAQLEPEVKNSISHRGLALSDLVEKLRTEFGVE